MYIIIWFGATQEKFIVIMEYYVVDRRQKYAALRERIPWTEMQHTKIAYSKNVKLYKPYYILPSCITCNSNARDLFHWYRPIRIVTFKLIYLPWHFECLCDNLDQCRTVRIIIFRPIINDTLQYCHLSNEQYRIFELRARYTASSQSSPSFLPSVTPSTFHSRLKTHLFHKSFPP